MELTWRKSCLYAGSAAFLKLLQDSLMGFYILYHLFVLCTAMSSARVIYFVSMIDFNYNSAICTLICEENKMFPGIAQQAVLSRRDPWY